MSYIIEQKIKGHVYLYEVQSYWDPKKKQARQRRKYLGKKDPQTQGPVTPRKLPVVSAAADYGHLYLLKQIASGIGLVQAALKSFEPTVAEALLSLAYFQVLEGKPLYLYSPWSEGAHGASKLDSQKISKLLHELGSDESQRNLFLHHWASQQKPLKGVWLDITSISSYSLNNHWLEWGYNRDREALPQVNLGVLVGGVKKLPFFYQLYPGSIADVSTLDNIGLRAKDLGFDIETWIMDRGFFSASNLDNLVNREYRFITAMPATLKLAHSLLASSQTSLRSPVNSFCLGKEVLFYHDTTCTIGSRSLRVCVYQSEKRRAAEVEEFIRRLDSVEYLAARMTFEDLDRAQEWLKGQWRGCHHFYTIALRQDKSLKLTRKRNAISFRMNRMGKMILVTNCTDLTPKELLDLYRNKDRVEKVYDSMKNSLNEDRLRTHGATTMHGKMFVTFLALILQTELSYLLHSSKFSKKYTVPELIMEFKKVRLFLRTQDQPPFLSEVSKKQRDLLAEFKIPLPTAPSLLTN
jgi:transposase